MKFRVLKYIDFEQEYENDNKCDNFIKTNFSEKNKV